MTIKTFNKYYNKRGAYMGEKNPENDKKAARGETFFKKGLTSQPLSYII